MANGYGDEFTTMRNAWIAKGRPADPADPYWASVLAADAELRRSLLTALSRYGIGAGLGAMTTSELEELLDKAKGMARRAALAPTTTTTTDDPWEGLQ